MKHRVLLLNPPGKYNYARDYYCSKVNKTNYKEHPIDLMYLSGVLYEAKIDFQVLDAIVTNKSENNVLELIESYQPTHIFFLSGWVSWKEDFRFLKSIKNRFSDLVCVGLGDIFLDQMVFKREVWIDAVLYDFTNGDILKYLQNEFFRVSDMLIRSDDQLISRKVQKKVDGKSYALPLPRYEYFAEQPYTFPFSRHSKYMTLLTDFGCPFRCKFCVYSEIGYKVQDLERVFLELRTISGLGFKELFIKDQTFCIKRERGEKLCQYMIDNDFNFSWTCFLRVNQADLDFLKLMKRAGCHTIIFGVESGNQKELDEYLKGTSIQEIKQAIANCKEVGIDSTCTFILGFPGQSQKSIEATVDFALEIDPTYAAFNTYVKKTESMGFDTNLSENHDQSGISDRKLEGNGLLSGEEILALRKKAVRRFYFRPQYIFNQVVKSRTFPEFQNKLTGFQFLVKSG